MPHSSSSSTSYPKSATSSIICLSVRPCVCLFVCLLVCLACSFIWRALITRHAYAALPLPLASFIKKPKERRQSCPAPTPTPTPATNPCQQQQQKEQQRSQAYAHNFRLAKFRLHISEERKQQRQGNRRRGMGGWGTVWPGSFRLNIIIICSRLALASSSTQMTVSCYLLSCLISPLPSPPHPSRTHLFACLSVCLTVCPVSPSLSLAVSFCL